MVNPGAPIQRANPARYKSLGTKLSPRPIQKKGVCDRTISPKAHINESIVTFAMSSNLFCSKQFLLKNKNLPIKPQEKTKNPPNKEQESHIIIEIIRLTNHGIPNQVSGCRLSNQIWLRETKENPHKKFELFLSIPFHKNINEKGMSSIHE